jgi:hypothetical protein
MAGRSTAPQPGDPQGAAFALRPQRHAHTHFMGSARDDMGHDAVESDALAGCNDGRDSSYSVVAPVTDYKAL